MSRVPPEEKVDQLLEAYNNRDFAAAERLARGLTRKWPGFGQGWNILSGVLHALGKLDKAAEAYKRALSLDPGHPVLHDNYGALLIQLSRSEEAAECFRRSLSLNPGSAGTHANLGTALLMSDEPEAAVEHCRRAVELQPRDASLHNTLGNALKACGDTESAKQAYHESIRLNPYYSKAQFNLATLYHEEGARQEAEHHYRQAIQSNPDYAKARCSLGNLLAMAGRLDEAEQSYREAIARQPDLAEAHRYLAWLKTFRADDPDLDAIEKCLSRSTLTDEDRAQLHYAAGKAYQDIGADPARAFDHFSKGAKLRRRILDYNVAADEASFREIGEAFSKRIEPLTHRRDGAPRVIFIVGMPRSGTTLVEQIVGAHSAVCPLGETGLLPERVALLDRTQGTVYPHWVGRVSGEALQSLETGYLERAQARCPGVGVFSDKMPDNFKYLGVIARAFPQARIVHVRRSPLDTCVSCYTQYFTSGAMYSYDLAELGRYYRAYLDLMAHWRDVLPAGLMLELEYESLVREPADQARRLLEHCGLSWEDRCLAFQENRRLIDTASVAQARQPVYQRSVGRWKIYEEWLAPLREVLGES